MSTTSPFEFSNLPTDTLGKIIEKCELKEQLTLRKVSKDLRSLVDKQNIAYKSIEIYLSDLYISCVYNREKVVYAGMNFDEKNAFGLDYGGCIIRSNDYLKIALNDLSIALKNPKLRLNVLTVSYYYNDVMNPFSLKNLLKHSNHKLHVKTLTFRAGSSECLLSILPFFKPKVLVNIEIDGVYDGDDWALEKVRQVASLNQWKQAEQLTARFSFHSFPSEFLMHFKRFVILDWEVDEFFLLFSTSTNFESCTIETFGLEDCSDYLESFCEQVDTEDLSALLYHYKIPDDSNQMLEFKLDYNQQKIIILKKNL
ncbi:hypothetical protein GCK72_021149 [Caenorhabditis remanei]|uniref:F-box domain-containing protein n=1 Tax=Caenorhabditis remanei TaxID=31234 RepID=A0A6A5GIX4_CAERE|nr:hypothetical protein GCK72_021149 [Caenorhabditis remanei]KAF1754586.1 hypothetical protein GCK72_021149 [Caenorhabditis remanei]